MAATTPGPNRLQAGKPTRSVAPSIMACLLRGGKRHDRDINAAKNLVKLFETFSTGASPGSNADGGVASTSRLKSRGKQFQRSQKSCKAKDLASLCL